MITEPYSTIWMLFHKPSLARLLPLRDFFELENAMSKYDFRVICLAIHLYKEEHKHSEILTEIDRYCQELQKVANEVKK